VELATTDDEADRLPTRIRDEGIDLFYLRTPARFGFIP
jgi:hypothetical protein